MRKLTILVALLAALYGGYWTIGATRSTAGAKAMLAGLAEAGWQVEYDRLRTRGFPSRFDTTAEGLTLFHPALGLGWQGDWLQVFSLSYRPGQIIVTFPDRMEITAAGRTLTLRDDRLQASARRAGTGTLALRAATAEVEGVRIDTGGDAPPLEIADGLVAFRTGTGTGAMDLYLNAAPLSLPGLTRIEADLALTFASDPWSVLEGRSPGLPDITLTSARLITPEGPVAVTGTLTAAGGYDGRLVLSADQPLTSLAPALAALFPEAALPSLAGRDAVLTLSPGGLALDGTPLGPLYLQ